MTRLRAGHVKSMRAFDRLPQAVRQALAAAVHNWPAPPLTKALKNQEASEAEIVERIRKQDAERVHRDAERREMEIDDGDD